MAKKQIAISLVQKKPKVYKTHIDDESQIKEFCKFLRNNKDREITVIINGKSVKFNSISGKKRFASGLEQGSSLLMEESKGLFKDMQGQINRLKSELHKISQDYANYKETTKGITEKLRANEVLKKIRYVAYQDHIQELEVDRKILKERLTTIEPIIKKISEVSTEGQLQNIYNLIKKNKL